MDSISGRMSSVFVDGGAQVSFNALAAAAAPRYGGWGVSWATMFCLDRVSGPSIQVGIYIYVCYD